jgi:hypothetical protein
MKEDDLYEIYIWTNKHCRQKDQSCFFKFVTWRAAVVQTLMIGVTFYATTNLQMYV